MGKDVDGWRGLSGFVPFKIISPIFFHDDEPILLPSNIVLKFTFLYKPRTFIHADSTDIEVHHSQLQMVITEFPSSLFDDGMEKPPPLTLPCQCRLHLYPNSHDILRFISDLEKLTVPCQSPLPVNDRIKSFPITALKKSVHLLLLNRIIIERIVAFIPPRDELLDVLVCPFS